MKKSLIIFCSAILFGCTSRSPETPEYEYIEIEPLITKTALSQNREKLIWKEGDSFSLFNNADKSNSTLTINGSNPLRAAIPSAATSVYGLYPANADETGGPGSVTITVPTTQTQSQAGEFDGSSYMMRASGAVSEGRATLSFHPVSCILALNIYSLGELQSGEAVTRVRVTPLDNTGFAGSTSADLSTEPSFTAGDNSSPITLNLNKPYTISASAPSDKVTFPGQLYVNIARQSYTRVKFEIETTAGLYTMTSSSTEAIDCTSSDFYCININLGKVPFVKGSVLSSLEGLDRLATVFDDVIPDFSRVGYKWGDEELPHLTNIVKTLNAPSDGSDATQLIQDALNTASTPGVVLLKAGTYNVSGILDLSRSGIVLRGEGDATKIICVGTTQRQLIQFGKKTSRVLNGQAIPVIDNYVPLGAFSMSVSDGSLFAVGDRVVIIRPGTAQWISDIKMDCIYTGSNPDTKQWKAEDYTMYWERIVTAVVGNRLYFENPVVMALDSRYPDSNGHWGYVQKSSWDRASEMGIEDVALISEYVAKGSTYVSTVEKDEDHGWQAVVVQGAEHCWLKGVSSRFFGYSLVSLGNGAKNITVTDCHCYQPVSIIDGSRRYAFSLSGGQLCLVTGCTCEYDRHQYVSGARVCGPNVFTSSSSTHSHSDAGPHHRWATGTLYDCLKLDGKLYVQDRESYGTGHGWAGANQVLWNCEVGTLVCQSPWTSAKNYCVGCTGTRLAAGRNYGDKQKRPDGEWASYGTHVTSGTWFGASATELSLYQSQKKARGGKRAAPDSCY